MLMPKTVRGKGLHGAPDATVPARRPGNPPAQRLHNGPAGRAARRATGRRSALRLDLLLQVLGRQRLRTAAVDVLAVQQDGGRRLVLGVAEVLVGALHPVVVLPAVHTLAEGRAVEPLDLLGQRDQPLGVGVRVLGLHGLTQIEDVVVLGELPLVTGAGRRVRRLLRTAAAHVAVDERHQVVLGLELARLLQLPDGVAELVLELAARRAAEVLVDGELRRGVRPADTDRLRRLGGVVT